MRAIAILTILCGLGFGLPGIFGLRHFAQHNSIWTFMGYPTYGMAPSRRSDCTPACPLLAGFLTVCIAELVVGGTGNPPTCGWR